MSDTDYITIAAEFLSQQDIGFVQPGEIGRKEDLKVEVIFLVLETLDPNVAVVDPPDIRVWVNTKNYEVELSYLGFIARENDK